MDKEREVNEQAQKMRLKKVCELLNDIYNNIEHHDKILNYVRTQIETNGNLVGGVGFIDYIKSNIVDNSALNIYGRGNPLLNKDRIDNIFDLLDTLKFDLSKTELNRIEKAPEASTNKQNTQLEETSSKIRGRTKSTFKDCILKTDKEKVVNELRKVLSGQKGKYVVLIIKICIEEGVIKGTTFQCLKDEFGDIGHRSGYNKYMNANESTWTDDEIKGARNTLKLILEQCN